jgi:hypothetical protein
MNEDARRSGTEPAQGAALELRVLSGVHAGARIELPALGPDNETTLSIGPGLDHDIVLSDAPGSAQLRGSRGLWTWEEQSFHEGLNSSGGWRWGPLTFSLGPPDARWALPERLLFDRSAPVAGEQSAGSARPSDDAQNSVSPADDAGLSRLAGPPSPDPGTISEATTPDATVTAPTQPPGTHGRRAAWAIVGMMLLIAALVLLMRSSPERTETVERPTPIVPTSVSPQQIDTAALKAALTQAGLAERVRLSPTADGRIRLSGVVADDDELDRAIAAVRPITRRIVQGILTQNEFKARVAAVQAEVPQAVRLQAEPVGRVRVLDWDRPGVDLNALRSWLAQALPETLAIDTPAPAPIAKRPEIVARSAPAPTPVAVAAIPILPAPPPDEPALPALPDIRLVIGGSNPYVVLGSGEKWLPGGQVGGWLLTAIEAQALVLEDRLGRQLRSPR